MDSEGPDSAFHAGERAIHERLGIHERMEKIGRTVIRDFMPDQHREFFAQQPLLFVGSLDALGQPWASALVGAPGFAHSPDPRRLLLQTRVIGGDPLASQLHDDARIGLLGLQFHTRRRNRVNGRIERLGADAHFCLHVEQSFGNCPKYIQTRSAALTPALATLGQLRPQQRSAALTLEQQRLIAQADTFFIASACVDADAGRGAGADVSHRGGRPGFLHAVDQRTLEFPDYVGNYLFNTLGNLLREPRCGLLLLDYERGDTLQLIGDAEILWERSQAAFAPGAQRMLRFHLREALQTRQALPLQWSFLEYSPHLDRW